MKIKALAICILLAVAGAVEAHLNGDGKHARDHRAFDPHVAAGVDPSGSIIVDTSGLYAINTARKIGELVVRVQIPGTVFLDECIVQAVSATEYTTVNTEAWRPATKDEIKARHECDAQYKSDDMKTWWTPNIFAVHRPGYSGYWISGCITMAYRRSVVELWENPDGAVFMVRVKDGGR